MMFVLDSRNRGRPYVLRLMGAGFSKPKNPIPGTDMAGIVESVGKSVTQFRPGNPVFGETIVTHQWIHGSAFGLGSRRWLSSSRRMYRINHF